MLLQHSRSVRIIAMTAEWQIRLHGIQLEYDDVEQSQLATARAPLEATRVQLWFCIVFRVPHVLDRCRHDAPTPMQNTPCSTLA